MRTGVGLAVSFLAVACVLPLAAQQPASSFLTGVRPEEIHLDKDYVKNATKAFQASPVIPTPSVQKRFSFLPKPPQISIPSWVPFLGKAPPPPRPQRPVVVPGRRRVQTSS
jgi:hypothetical protein